MLVENYLSKENKILFDLLANSLFDAKIEIDFDGADLEKLFAEARVQTVSGFAFDALPTAVRAGNEAVYDQWKGYVFTAIQKNLRQMRSNAELERLFAEAGLPVCTLKGFASGYYYGDKKHLRQMGDIDFLVPGEKLEASKNLLLEHGFAYVEDSSHHDFHLSFWKNGELYELHKGITSLADGTEDIDQQMAELLEKSVKKEFDGVRITIPDVFSHGLIMLLHMKRHMLTGGGVGLRHLCDWAVFVDSMDDAAWCSIFEEKLKAAKLWKFAQALGKASSRYLKMEEREWFSHADTALSERLLEDIVVGGNFGEKSVLRIQEISFLSKNKKGKSKLKFYLEGLIDKVYHWKPFYKEHKRLLPFAMIAYLVRIFYFTLFCKGKLNFFEIQKSGKSRNNLYHQLFQ